METATLLFWTVAVIIFAFVMGIICGVLIMIIARAGKTYDERVAFLMDKKESNRKPEFQSGGEV